MVECQSVMQEEVGWNPDPVLWLVSFKVYHIPWDLSIQWLGCHAKTPKGCYLLHHIYVVDDNHRRAFNVTVISILNKMSTSQIHFLFMDGKILIWKYLCVFTSLISGLWVKYVVTTIAPGKYLPFHCTWKMFSFSLQPENVLIIITAAGKCLLHIHSNSNTSSSESLQLKNVFIVTAAIKCLHRNHCSWKMSSS